VNPVPGSYVLINPQLVLNNLGQDDMTEVKIGAKNLAPGMSLHEFPGIATLAAGASQIVSLGINFNDTTQPAKFDLVRLLLSFLKLRVLKYFSDVMILLVE
jgi:hypothetical protein